MKKCSCCKKFKKKSEFGKNKYAKKDGLQNQCKICMRASVNAYYQKHKKGKKVYGKKIIQKNAKLKKN